MDQAIAVNAKQGNGNIPIIKVQNTSFFLFVISLYQHCKPFQPQLFLMTQIISVLTITIRDSSVLQGIRRTPVYSDSDSVNSLVYYTIEIIL